MTSYPGYNQELKRGSDAVLRRTLTEYEVSIIKGMQKIDMPRDEALSFFALPGRKLNPAAYGEIRSEVFGGHVDPAPYDEVVRYIRNRTIASAALLASQPNGEVRAQEFFSFLQSYKFDTRSLFGDEDEGIEFKVQIPSSNREMIKVAKTCAAMANNIGGYIAFGIDDKANPKGIDATAFTDYDWDKFSRFLHTSFSPSIKWSKACVEITGHPIGLIYISKSIRPPITCTRDSHSIVFDGDIYFRYKRESKKIRWPELQNLLRVRDEFSRREYLRDFMGTFRPPEE